MHTGTLASVTYIARDDEGLYQGAATRFSSVHIGSDRRFSSVHIGSESFFYCHSDVDVITDAGENNMCWNCIFDDTSLSFCRASLISSEVHVR